MDQEKFDRTIKALRITDETVLFVDLYQVPVELLAASEFLPKGLVIVGVCGVPNVEAMTRAELQEILDRKDAPAVEA